MAYETRRPDGRGPGAGFGSGFDPLGGARRDPDPATQRRWDVERIAEAVFVSGPRMTAEECFVAAEHFVSARERRRVQTTTAAPLTHDDEPARLLRAFEAWVVLEPTGEPMESYGAPMLFHTSQVALHAEASTRSVEQVPRVCAPVWVEIRERRS